MQSDKGLSISAALGHNASAWLAEALNLPGRNIKSYHQRLFKVCNFGGWSDAFKYQLENPIDAPRLTPYWNAVNKEISKGFDVFDSNIWPAYLIPALNDHYPLKNVIYVTRNGFKWVYSVSRASGYREHLQDKLHHYQTNHFGIDGYLRQYWEVLDRPYKDWSEWGNWERVFLYWSTSYHMPKWLERRGVKVHIFKMESLVSNTMELRKLYKLFGFGGNAKSMQKMQEQNINQHIESKNPKDIRESWSKERLEDFVRICGEGMEHYGYEI